MAKVGGGSAYVRLEKPDNAISQSFQYWGGLKAQEIEADKGRAERAQLRQAQQNKEWEEKYGYKYDDFLNKVTGFDSYDQVKTDYAQQVSDKYIELNRKAQEALSSGNLKDRRKYETEMMRLKGAFKQVQQADAIIGQRFQESMKMAQEGKMSGVDSDSWDAEMQAISKDMNYRVTIGENGSPEIVGVKTLMDGSQEPFSIRYSDIVNGTWRPYRKQDIAGKGGLVNNVLDRLGAETTVDRNGALIVTNQKWDAKREKASQGYIDSLLASDEITADLYNQMIDGNSRKRTGFTGDEKKQVADRMMELVKGGYTEVEGLKVDVSEQALAETRRRNLAQEDIARQGLQAKLNNAKNRPLSKVEQVDLANRSKSVIAYGLTNRLEELQKANPNITDREIMEDKEIQRMRDVLGIDLDERGFLFGRSMLDRGKGKLNIGNKTYDIKDKGKIANAIADELGFIYDGRVVKDDFEEIGGYDGLYKKDMIQVIKNAGTSSTQQDTGQGMSDDEFERYLQEQGLN